MLLNAEYFFKPLFGEKLGLDGDANDDDPLFCVNAQC